MVKIAITKGRIEKDVCKLMQMAGFDIDPIINKNRKLKVSTNDGIEAIFTKPNDALAFVERGIVDMAFVGKDTLDESNSLDYKELLDLKIGKCFFALASNKDYTDKKFDKQKKIATKYPNIAKKYFFGKNENVEIIKMDGSVELGPVVGMTDAIVDIVETGSTLEANGLVILDKISDISTRLITNKESLNNKNNEIYNIVNKLSEQIKKEE